MKRLLQLLLGAKVVGVSTLLLATVDSTGVQTGIAPVGRDNTKLVWNFNILDNHYIKNTGFNSQSFKSESQAQK